MDQATGTGQRIPESVVDSARARIVDVVERYGVDLQANGSEFKALCPFHEEKTPSFTVVPEKEMFYCFGCGASGDAIDFVTTFEPDLSFPAAVRKITGDAAAEGPAPRRGPTKKSSPPEWEPVTPVPADMADRPMTIFNRRKGDSWERLTSSARWAYLDADDNLIGYTCRFELPGGGKDVMPQTWCVNRRTGEASWRWLSFGKPRPLYGLGRLAAHPRAQVIIAEGEKAADAAQALYQGAGIPMDKLVVVSWPGGGKAVKHTDWSPLAGRSVGLWPDADQKHDKKTGELLPVLEQPGVVCMLDIADRLDAIAAAVKIIAPPPDVPDGWDLADELPEGFNLVAHTKAAALPAAEFRERHAPPEPGEDTPPWEEPHTDEQPPEDDTGDVDEDEPEGYFTILGYDHGRYYVFQHETKQISVLTQGNLSVTGLIALAPIQWWELNFPSDKGLDVKAAVNWFIRSAHSRGIYDPSLLRGRGAWQDDGRTVFHFGGSLQVDGVPTDVTRIDSRYTYELERPLPHPDVEPLTAEEGKHLLDIAGMFRWTKEGSAPLLAGFTALAPLCGALKWRPHIWLTGAAGSGKSTLLNEYVHTLMGGMAVYAQGNSTEAGIRQTLRSDALPVLFDESESNEENDRKRIQGVLALIRQASTESAARTLKGTAGGDAMHFHIRSMFCLASIQVGMKYQADFERLAVLSLRPKRDDGSEAEKQRNSEQWNQLKEVLYGLQRDETLPARLFRRSLNLLPTTLKNIDVFAEVAGLKFGSQRDGDQYGTMMAGAWSLVSDEEVTPEQARAWLDRYDWSEYLENADTEESVKALGALLESQVRISGGAIVNVYELVKRAAGQQVPSLSLELEEADAILQRHGMKVRDDRLLLSNNSQELRRLVAGTPYESDLRGQLLRVRGADRYNNRSSKFNGIDSKCVSLPLFDIVYDEPGGDIPF